MMVLPNYLLGKSLGVPAPSEVSYILDDIEAELTDMALGGLLEIYLAEQDTGPVINYTKPSYDQLFRNGKVEVQAVPMSIHRDPSLTMKLLRLPKHHQNVLSVWRRSTK